MKEQPKSGAVVLADDLKNPAMEKLDLVRKWSINTYKVLISVLDNFFSLGVGDLYIISVLGAPICYLVTINWGVRWQSSELYHNLTNMYD